jgi:predicted nucleic acid-binding protein
MPFVLDTSVTMAWHFPDELSVPTQRLRERCDHDSIVVPSHWAAEVGNALVVGERRQRATAAQTADFVDQLFDIPREVDVLMPDHVLRQVMPLARAHRLTIYDALYLELAERRGLALATLDAQLADAARSVGVEVLGQEA